MTTLPTSATLDGVKLHFRECHECSGLGDKITVEHDSIGRPYMTRRIICRGCAGKGFHRQLGAFAG